MALVGDQEFSVPDCGKLIAYSNNNLYSQHTNHSIKAGGMVSTVYGLLPESERTCFTLEWLSVRVWFPE